jgi:formate dehydrogenase major subunit
MADYWLPLRAGSDIAFLGGLIRYTIENDRYFREYVVRYTNAPTILRADFQDTEELGGLFSGWDAGKKQYDPESWLYEGTTKKDGEAPGMRAESGGQEKDRGGESQNLDDPHNDETLQHPRCVFQVLKRHFARYTPELVERVCGVPQDVFVATAEAILNNSGRERTTSFAYAVAWTQHTVGTQIIACCAILQLLLGNIGRPGGGILALRGHATIQGSTDIPTLYNLLPGYLPMPQSTADEKDPSLEAYLERHTPPTGAWTNTPKFLVSLLKAWYGEAATPDNGFAFDLVPKIGDDYSFEAMVPLMAEGTIKGLFCMGQNPAVGGQNAILARKALGTLDWLVVRDIHEIETAAFWYDAPEVRNGEIRPEEIGTEIFLMPAALPPEKDGSFTNTQRLVQWHDKAVDPPGDCRSETWFVYHLGVRLKELYRDDAGPTGRQITAVTWDYPVEGPLLEPVVEAIVAEINGYTVADGRQLPDLHALRDDGSTASGCWIYSGIMPEAGKNLSRSRVGDDRAALGWGYAWPLNERILYNRASADPQGRPWSERKKWVWWDAERGEWTGYDVPDFPRTKPPDYEPPDDARGTDAHAGDAPFVNMADGRGWLFAASGLRDGPLPTHYEPWESPVGNLLYPDQARNPVALTFQRPDNRYHQVGDPRFPYVITTYRLTEHHTAGGMTRWVPWLAELQPQGFVELSPELAAEHGIENGDWVTLTTLRGEIETRALVTERLQPLIVDGRTVHQIGMPWHFGFGGLATGSIANDLTPLIEDPNSRIHEGKAFTCTIRRGRLGEAAHGEEARP